MSHTHDEPTPAHPTTPPAGAAAKLRALTASFLVFLVLASVAAVTVLVYVAYQNKKNGDRLIDCTTPGHACYEQGQTQTASAVETLVASAIAANACSIGLEQPLTREQFPGYLKCVKDNIPFVQRLLGQ
jgi:hypothetical protein